MSAGDGPPLEDRVRFLLAENSAIAIGICLLLVLGGGFVAYQAHAGPDTRPEQQVAGTWTTNASFDHGAVVQRDSLAFDAGAVVQNRSVYFRRVTPTLNGTYEVAHAGSPADVTVRTDLRLVVRSVDDGADGERVLWEVSEFLGTTDSTDSAPGRPHRVTFDVNVSERIETATRIRQDLASTLGEPEVLLVAETRTETTLAGESVTQTRRDRLRIRPRGGIYQVAPATDGPTTETVSETVAVPVETDPLRAYGSILAVLVGLVCGAGLRWLDRNDALGVAPGTAAAIRSARERDSFGEWISHGRVPPAATDERVVEVDSLEDLVDVAIDSDRRVVRDDDTDVFVVFDGSTRYRFQPDGDAGRVPADPGPAVAGRARAAHDGADGDGREPTSRDDEAAQGDAGTR